MTKDDIATEMANCLLIGKPIPDELINNLMVQMCEEVKQERIAEERERGTIIDSKEAVAKA